MVNLLRILLFTLCIISSPAHAIETHTSEAPPEVEVLENTYVKIDIPTDIISSFSILKAFDRVLILAKDKYYSLLNWNTYSRRAGFNIPKYRRIEQFGRWINDPEDATCYNTRALVLIRDSDKEVTLDENNKCSVVSGSWKDDYTGEIFKSRDDIQIDHVVPLKNTYISGGYRWSFKARCLYANYLGYDFHLKSVNGSENMKKGDKSPDKYMPPNPEHACTYLKNWLTIKFLWGLQMKNAEADFIYKSLRDNHCNLTNFKISQQEILIQNQFAHENQDLCGALDTP